MKTKTTIGDISVVVTKGTTPTTYGMPFVGKGINFVKAEALNGDSSLERSGFAYINEETHQRLARSKLMEGDVLVTIAGANVGKCGFVEKGILPANTNQAVGIIRPDREKVCPKYLYYWLKRPQFKQYCHAVGGQSAQPNLNLTNLKKIKLILPNMPIQERIASCLFAHDELIENNQRRVRLLEKSAHLLYREWFVRFRFSQDKNENNTNALPSGWREVHVSKVIQRVPAGKTYSQKSVMSAGKVPVLGQSSNGVIGYHDNEPSVKASADEPVIVFANHTCNQRFMFEPFSGIKNILPFKPKFPEKHDIYWLHHATRVLIKMNAYKGHWPELMAKTLIVPTNKLTFDFGKQVKPIHLQIFNLMKQNEKLAKARDLLLPRLLDGRIKL